MFSGMSRKITAPLMIMSLGAFSVALFSAGCGSSDSPGGTGGKVGTGGMVGTGGAGTGGAGTGGAGTGGAGTGGQGTGGQGTGGAAGGRGGGAAGAGIGGALGGRGGAAAGGRGGGTAGAGVAGAGVGGRGGGTAGAGVAGAGVGGAGGGAALMTFMVTLNGPMEGNTSTATGMATVTLNSTTGAVTVNGTFTGLSGGAAVAHAAHIHGLAPAGMNANVIITLMAADGPAGALTGTGTLTAPQTAGMIAGMTYLNIHSPAPFAAGEIRGQIQ